VIIHLIYWSQLLHFRIRGFHLRLINKQTFIFSAKIGNKNLPRINNITINVPVVYMVRNVVVLRRKIHNKGHFRGGGPKNRDFFGP
jgi:hypothetical protein